MKNQKLKEVSPELALKLKDIGFNIPCKDWYYRPNPVESILHNDNTEFDYNSSAHNCSAPTLALTQSWMWKENKLWVEIMIWEHNFSYCVKSSKGNSVFYMSNSSVGHNDDPDDALDSGLRKACDIILESII
jgi:hypothetical protein